MGKFAILLRPAGGRAQTGLFVVLGEISGNRGEDAAELGAGSRRGDARELNWPGFFTKKFMQELRPFLKVGLREPARSALEC